MAPADRFCRRCGCDSTVPLGAPSPAYVDHPSDCKRLVAFLLCFLLGVFGVHRFYVGKIGTGLLWLVTFGFLTIGMLFDLILIIAGEFRDKHGRRVIVW